MFKTMKVTYDDKSEVECHGKKSDVVLFERQFNVPASKMFDDGVRTEYLWFFAHVALKRDGETRPFDDWMLTVDSVDIVTADDATPPTEPDGSPTP